MDTKHAPGGYHVTEADIPGPMDHKRYQEPIRRPTPRLRRHPVRPEGLGFHMPRHSTGQPAWFAEMRRANQ